MDRYWSIVLVGDDTTWSAPPNPDFWNYNEDADEWVAKPEDELPEGTYMVNGMPALPRRMITELYAPDADSASQQALEHNSDYHTVESVTDITDE